MTAKELIEKLKLCDPNAEVKIDVKTHYFNIRSKGTADFVETNGKVVRIYEGR